MRLRAEMWELDRLSPYDHNSKSHSAEQVEAIKRSILRFGFNDPIAVTDEGVIVEGHGRLEAARILRLEQVPVIVLEGMSERDVDLYRIAHNKISIAAGFNFVALAQELRELTRNNTYDIDFSMMGFSETAAWGVMAAAPESVPVSLEQGLSMVAQTAESETEEADPDSAPEERPETLDGQQARRMAVNYDLIWDEISQRQRFQALMRRLSGRYGEGPKELHLVRMVRETRILEESAAWRQ